MRGDRPQHGELLLRYREFPPHARGSTISKAYRQGWPNVSPACAGIDLYRRGYQKKRVCFPRMRGDRPRAHPFALGPPKFPPHARGSTMAEHLAGHPGNVSPACAGIDLSRLFRALDLLRFPRMRGDRPHRRNPRRRGALFPPHARGSTSSRWSGGPRYMVSPACAGIDRSKAVVRSERCCFPRMRGDRPRYKGWPTPLPPFPPHARGSTAPTLARVVGGTVSPACAGIDPTRFLGPITLFSFPRMRGDRPYRGSFGRAKESFPPHARGSTACSRQLPKPRPVFPACAGIDLRLIQGCPATISFPRMRGDRPRH